MGLMTQILGPRESIFMTYVVGTLIAFLMIGMAHGGNLKSWQTVPWYAFTAGLFGLVIVGSIGYVIPRLGLSTGFTVIVATQFIGGVIIDHYGLFGATVRPIDGPKLVGLGLLMAGVALLVRQ